ncbi:G-protein coupled receptor GRL101 [Stylophora pistillata]|uniref:G-protein coupled receptor GRL101 n=1 Tax=Stylophora pistillata TaxID=50429 RepID=A0A2B4RT35_STYPI|nr:G-protein coupled receptor GRL101 [Stylophora pistillata]
MSLVGAVFVIVWRLVFKETKEKNKIQSIMLIHLAGSDGLMGIYLIIIGVMDAIWAGQYFLHDYNWRSSLSCQITGAIAVLSSEVSVMTICLISADRVKNILFPYRGKSLTIKVTHLLCFLIWIVGGLIAFIPTVGIEYFGSRKKGHHFYGRSVVCLPLQLSADKPSGWEYSVAMFVGLNFALVFFIIVAYCMIIYKSCTSNRRLAQQGTKRERKMKAKQRAADLRREASLAKRVLFIVLTDCVCWLPIVVIGMRSLLEKSFRTPGDLAVWIAVFVLSVNSAINPILYTLSTKQNNEGQDEGMEMQVIEEGSAELIAQLQQMQLDASKVNDKTDLKNELKKISSDKGFRIVDNDGSGNCMFYALSDQLEIAMRIKIKHDELRQMLVQYLRKNPELEALQSFCGSPTYQLSKYLTTILQTLTDKSRHKLQSTEDFINATKTVQIPDDYKLVSFDVKSLFTSIPLQLALQCTETAIRRIAQNFELQKRHFGVQNQEETGSADDSEDESQEEQGEGEQHAGSGQENEEPTEPQQTEPEQGQEPKQGQDEATEQRQVEREQDEEPKQGQKEANEQEQVQSKRDEEPKDDNKAPTTKQEVEPDQSKGNEDVCEQQPKEEELKEDHEKPGREQAETAEEEPKRDNQEFKQQRTQQEEKKELKADHGLKGGAKEDEKSKGNQKEGEQRQEENEEDEQEQGKKYEKTEEQRVDCDREEREKVHNDPKHEENVREKPRGRYEELNQEQLCDETSKRGNEDPQQRCKKSMENESPRHQQLIMDEGSNVSLRCLDSELLFCSTEQDEEDDMVLDTHL